MVGQATARLEPYPRRWIQSVWGHGDIDMRQKWWALWPHLSKLPTTGLDILDAGCGAGRWVLELAARRPQWQVQGIDRDRGTINAAERARQRLGVENVSFLQAITSRSSRNDGLMRCWPFLLPITRPNGARSRSCSRDTRDGSSRAGTSFSWTRDGRAAALFSAGCRIPSTTTSLLVRGAVAEL